MPTSKKESSNVTVSSSNLADPSSEEQEPIRRHPQELGEVQFLESIERWIRGKSTEELLAALKVYAKSLADNPHSIPERLNVASIQLHLGRKDEAFIQYEGVLREHLTKGDVLSALALSEYLLGYYPDAAKLKRVLAALYARAPRGRVPGAALATPISNTDEAFFLDVQEVRPYKEKVRVARMFDHNDPYGSQDELESLLESDELKPENAYSSSKKPKTDREATPSHVAVIKKK